MGPASSMKTLLLLTRAPGSVLSSRTTPTLPTSALSPPLDSEYPKPHPPHNERKPSLWCWIYTSSLSSRRTTSLVCLYTASTLLPAPSGARRHQDTFQRVSSLFFQTIHAPTPTPPTCSCNLASPTQEFRLLPIK